MITIGLVASLEANAASPVDKPVLTIGSLSVIDSGGVSPDTWRTYVTYQDITAGTSTVNGERIKPGVGRCGPECNNYGKINYNRTLGFAYRSVCGHWLRAWPCDQTKSPQAGYGWSYRDTLVRC